MLTMVLENFNVYSHILPLKYNSYKTWQYIKIIHCNFELVSMYKRNCATTVLVKTKGDYVWIVNF